MDKPKPDRKYIFLHLIVIFSLYVLSMPGCGEFKLNNDSTTVQPVSTLNISPDDFDFGTVTTHHSVSTVVTASNPGPSDITISGMVLSDKTNFFLDLSGGSRPMGSLPTILNPGDSRTFTARFSPQSSGIYDLELTIEYEDAVATIGTQSVSTQKKGDNPGKGKRVGWYRGNAVDEPVPNIKITPRDHNFGDVVSGNFSSPLEISIANEGVADLTISDTILSESMNFDLDNYGGSYPCGSPPATVPPGQSRTVTVTFNPYSTGILNSVLTVSSNDPDTNGNDVQISGNAVPAPVPNISVSPLNHDFGDVPAGDASQPATINISNVGTADLHISDMDISDTANFNLNVNGGLTPCGSRSPVLSVGQSCQVTVTFSPFSTGSFDAVLSINSDDPDTPGTNIFTTGNAIPYPVPGISVSPATHDFGDVSSGSSSIPLELWLSNTGTGDLNISNIYLSDTTNFDLNVSEGSNPCGSLTPTISPGQNCTVTATFSPVSNGPFSADLTVGSDDQDNGVAVVSLNGNGITATTSDVTLAWDPPTSKTDGSALPPIEINRYVIYYGTSSGNYSQSVNAGNVTQYTVTNLSSGTWYFSVTVIDTSGYESDFSEEVFTQVN